MILAFLFLFVAIPVIFTFLLRKFLFDKLNFSANNKKIALVLAYLFSITIFICLTLYFSFGPLFYGHRQAAQFYNLNKNELRYLITKFERLEKNGLFSVSKSSENNLKITLELSNQKGTIEFLVNDKAGKYEMVKMSNNQPVLIYNPLKPTSLQEIFIETQIDKEEFNSLLQQLKKAHVINIRGSTDEYLIGIRETFPFQIAYLFFCKAESNACNKDKGKAQIDKGVYFDKFSDP